MRVPLVECKYVEYERVIAKASLNTKPDLGVIAEQVEHHELALGRGLSLDIEGETETLSSYESRLKLRFCFEYGVIFSRNYSSRQHLFYSV